MGLGIALIIASQLVAAGQLLLDQSQAASRLHLSPLKVVGCEGLLGLALMVSAAQRAAACQFVWARACVCVRLRARASEV